MLKWIIVFSPTLFVNKCKIFHLFGELMQAESSIAALFVIRVCREGTAIWWEGWDSRWETGPGVHACCWLQSPFLESSFLLPTPQDWRRRNVTWMSTTVNCLHGMTVVNQSTLVIAADWFVWCLQTHKFAARADQKQNMSFISVMLGEGSHPSQIVPWPADVVHTAFPCLWSF